MKITIGILGILSILMIVSVSATYYPGTSYIFPNEMGITNLVYTIVDNSTPVNLNITINSTNIIIHFLDNSSPDTFHIVFLENQTNTVIQTITNTVHRSSGGGTRTIYEDRYITQPKFYDRNFTTEKETIVIEPFETLIKETTGYKLWHIFVAIIATLVLAILLYIFIKLLYNNNYEEEEEEENPISWEQRMRENNEIVRKREDREIEY